MRWMVLSLWLTVGSWMGGGAIPKDPRRVFAQGTAQACTRHPWLCAGYDSQDAWRRALEAARAADTLLDAAEGESVFPRQSTSVFSSVDPEGTIKRLDEHIHKVESVCPSGNPDPRDPKHENVNHWKTEIRAFVKNLKQILKRMPNNKIKRRSVEEAIRRGDNALERWGSS